MGTYGPAYSQQIDGPRIATQLEVIRQFCLGHGWLSLAEIEAETGYPQASVSAQLRHLRKKAFGAYRVEKRRRSDSGGTWEYRVQKSEPIPPKQGRLF